MVVLLAMFVFSPDLKVLKKWIDKKSSIKAKQLLKIEKSLYFRMQVQYIFTIGILIITGLLIGLNTISLN